uniref:Chromatin modification-related protein MEAF6 n=1 Tax=Pinguiococcus pyrenoidosus TaxID=172671 RepID=A0A7R9UDF4_9STRA|mmetsp:Transcript_5528/g.21813  ORF Transcript_5528/g.21813 Transcript_5528/m.21813 type:complete len:153 (+) Transcript_5528:80-538(+)|eukprot:scaffold447_cov307-Pinguiococcus_pyrenoidosus.AAC.86
MEAQSRYPMDPVELVLAKKRLQDGLEDVERQLGNMERKYLEESRDLGNVLHGFHQLVAADSSSSKDKHASRERGPSNECLFSLSSSTSAASASLARSAMQATKEEAQPGAAGEKIAESAAQAKVAAESAVNPGGDAVAADPRKLGSEGEPAA